jgi:hypothetical protein
MTCEDDTAKAVKLHAAGLKQVEIGAELGVHQSTVSRALANARDFMTDRTQLDVIGADQFRRITEKWAEIDSDKTMTSAEKHRAWAMWMKLEMDLCGTSAPSKSITAHIGAQLDPLYLDVRAVLQDLEETDQLAGLELLREWAASKLRPTIEAKTKELDGEKNP